MICQHFVVVKCSVEQRAGGIRRKGDGNLVVHRLYTQFGIRALPLQGRRCILANSIYIIKLNFTVFLLQPKSKRPQYLIQYFTHAGWLVVLVEKIVADQRTIFKKIPFIVRRQACGNIFFQTSYFESCGFKTYFQYFRYAFNSSLLPIHTVQNGEI